MGFAQVPRSLLPGPREARERWTSGSSKLRGAEIAVRASGASFRWSLNLCFQDSHLSEHSAGKPEVGRGELGTRRRRFGGRMGGLSNFLSWVPWGGGLRRRGKGRLQLASPRGLEGVRLTLSRGALEALQSLVFLFLFVVVFCGSYPSWSLLPGACRASAVRAAGP